MFNQKLIKLIGFPPRFKDEPIEKHHKDLAAAVQQWYERNFYFIINRILCTRASENLVLSGGCAYNGTANGKINKNNISLTYKSIVIIIPGNLI